MLDFLRKLIIICGILCITAGAFAQTIPLPIYSPGSEGMEMYITGQQFRSEDRDNYYTTFSGSIRVLTSEDKTTMVVPKDATAVNIYTKVWDADYVWDLLNGKWVETFIPTQYRMYYTTLSGIGQSTTLAHYGEKIFSKNVSGISPGKLNISASVEDDSVVPNSLGSIKDADASAGAAVWIVDLEQQAGTINTITNEVQTIKLTTNPSTFPHEDICYIGVFWGGMQIPGMPVPSSNLYTDAACTNLITGDNGTTEKRWKIPDQPSKIYYKTSSTSGSQTIVLKILVKLPSTNSYMTFQQKNLTASVVDLKVKSIDSTSNLKGYWTGSMEDPYPSPEYLDGNNDGVVSDPIATDTDDKNRPFVFVKDSNFKINQIVITKSSSFDTTGKKLSVTSSDGSITNDNIAYTVNGNNITASNITGAIQGVIASKDVTFTWKLGTTTIGTTIHKVYVPKGNESSAYHTLMKISCDAAVAISPADQNDPQKVFNAIWDKFNKPSSVELYRIDGQGPLKYYGDDWKTGCGYQDTDYLLYALDAQCGNWANMFIDTLKIHGITANYIRLDKEDITRSHNGHTDTSDGFLQNAQVGQGKTDLGKLSGGAFGWHAIVEYNNKIYDPGIGAGPYNDLNDYINNALYVDEENWICP